MQIVVLDGYTMNPGDLSWDALAALGELEVFDRSTPEEIALRARQAEVVITNKAPLLASALGELPALKFIAVTATGVNVVDLREASRRGVVVSNVPAYGTESVAQFTIALLLNLASRVGQHAHAVQRGAWADADDFCFWEDPLVELHGRTLGIVGMGAIGRRVGQIANALGMKVLGARRSGSTTETPPWGPFAWREVDEIFAEADVVSLHCPLRAETEGLVDARRLRLMKPTALLLNTARGPLVDEAALAHALESGQIAGAGLDVVSVEPILPGNPILGAPNCILTPHIAWATFEARQRLMTATVDNVRAFLAGDPINVVG